MARPRTLVESEATTIPELEPGDHLSRDEFERHYDAMPDLKKAELIEGIVYMASPVGATRHGQPHGITMTWLGNYRVATPGTLFFDNTSVRLDGEEMPQPDAILIIEQSCGGRASLSEDDYIEGALELVVEIASSTASIDLNTKLRVYQRNNVREYLVWRVLDHAIDWFALVDGKYQRIEPGPDGITRSQVFPGLWLDTLALVDDRLAMVMEVLQRGLADTTHIDFVARLNPSNG